MNMNELRIGIHLRSRWNPLKRVRVVNETTGAEAYGYWWLERSLARALDKVADS